MFSSVESASFRTKCHTAGENSRGRPQATSAECWFLPSERTRRHAEWAIAKKKKKKLRFLNNIKNRGILSMFSSVESASFRTKCHTAGAKSRGRSQATSTECWFLPNERTDRDVE